MGELLDELRAELINKHGQLRDAEDELIVYVDVAAHAIEKVESQKKEIKALREEMSHIEDIICRLSS